MIDQALMQAQTTYPLLSPKEQPVVVDSALPNPGLVSLKVECYATEYKLLFHTGDNGREKVVGFDASKLTVMPPVGGAFTGAMYGVYAFGKGEPVLDPADFTDIRVAGLM